MLNPHYRNPINFSKSQDVVHYVHVVCKKKIETIFSDALTSSEVPCATILSFKYLDFARRKVVIIHLEFYFVKLSAFGLNRPIKTFALTPACIPRNSIPLFGNKILVLDGTKCFRVDFPTSGQPFKILTILKNILHYLLFEENERIKMANTTYSTRMGPLAQVLHFSKWRSPWA